MIRLMAKHIQKLQLTIIPLFLIMDVPPEHFFIYDLKEKPNLYGQNAKFGSQSEDNERR